MNGVQIACWCLLGCLCVSLVVAIVLSVLSGRYRRKHDIAKNKDTKYSTLSGVFTVLLFPFLIATLVTAEIGYPGPKYVEASGRHYLYNQTARVASYANSLSTPKTPARIVAEADRAWYVVQEVQENDESNVGYGFHDFHTVQVGPAYSYFRVADYGWYKAAVCLVYNASTTDWRASSKRCSDLPGFVAQS
jgi:hypothetical protein